MTQTLTNQISDNNRRRTQRWFTSARLVLCNNAELIRRSLAEVGHGKMRLRDLDPNIAGRPGIVGAGLGLHNVVCYWTSSIVTRWGPGEPDRVTSHCGHDRFAWLPWFVYRDIILTYYSASGGNQRQEQYKKGI